MKPEKPKSHPVRLALIILILTGPGCKDLPVPGDYRGNLSLHQIPQLIEAERTPVQVQVTYLKELLTVAILDPQTHSPFMQPLTISQKNKDTIAVSIPDYAGSSAQPILLKKTKLVSGTCYQSQPATLPLASEMARETASAPTTEVTSLCFDPDNFTFSFQGTHSEWIHLYATQFKPERTVILEPFQTLTVSQSVDRILDKNYDVQEARQSLLRASETATRAYLNLLPHISVGGAIVIGAVVAGELWELNRPLNDLISFIFPGRWVKARSLTWQARAESITNTLFKINMGTSVQTLSVALRAHRELRDELQTLQDQLTEVHKTSQQLFDQNRIEANSILTIEIALNDLNVALWQAQNQFTQDRINISQTLGFENPEAIEDMILEKETTLMNGVPILSTDDLLHEKQRYAELAVGNSFELRQLEYLHRAAELNELNVYLNWLDVYATMDLGFNLIADGRLAKSMVKSLEIKAEKTRQSLIAKTYNILRDRNILRQTFEVYDSSLKDRRERLNLLIERLNRFAVSTDPTEKLTVQASDIRGSVRDVASGMSGYYNTQAAILIDQASLDRLALQGVYEQFLPHLDGSATLNAGH